MTHKPDGRGYRSPLAPYVASMREPDPAAGRSACERAWKEQGLAVFNPAHLTWPEATRVKQLAEEIYGPRKEQGA